MAPIHTILLATDFSEPAKHALRLACSLARDYDAHLIVLHVAVPPPMVYGEGILPPDPEVLAREAREQLDRLQFRDTNLHVERRFEEGDATTEILRVAAETRADLIVMGTHGRTGLSRLLMGSIAEQVVRRAPCSVLTVKAPRPEAVAASEPRTVEALSGAR
jgi:nucleotide-binding universal stress UspA family protein